MFFDIQGYFEMSVFEISRADYLFFMFRVSAEVEVTDGVCLCQMEMLSGKLPN